MNMAPDSVFLSKLMKSADTFELKYDFSCELYRLSTYSAFPAGVPVSERSLARAGFYYTGVNDKVKCFCCGLMLDNWKQGDSPVEKHRQLYPSCSFVRTLNPAGSLETSPQPPLLSAEPSAVPSLFASLENTGYFSGSYSSFPSDAVNFRANQDCPTLRTSPYHFAMNTEKARLLTYQTWPLSFLSPAELARAGFYYVGPGDRVACFACGGKLSNWEPKDDAMSEHRRHFPNCPFLKDPSQSASRYSVSNLSMQTHAARVRTFFNWPPSAPVHPQQLASAGFYYTGHSDDVKCFCCDGGLRCWESGDDPWVEHAKWFPRCEYLIRIKGQEFVGQVQAGYPHLLEQLLSTSDTPEDESAESPNDLTLIRKNKIGLSQHLTCVMPILDCLLSARAISEQEYDAVKQKPQTLQARTLIDTVLAKGNTAATSFRNSLQESDPVLYKDLFVRQDVRRLPTDDIAALPMEEQLRKLQEERTCKVCMDREVSIVFIPCGHLVVCKDCAPSLRKCPICRETQRFSISNLSMQTHTARMRTFLCWPSSVPVQPEQLASAGFYYVDRNDDVKCFCCDGGLRCWESGDDPWVEHAKWFPRCEFLIRMKGQEFVDEIQARYPHLLEQLLSTSDTPGEENGNPPIMHFGLGESSEDVVMMNTPVVKAALEMGFSRSLVRQTVQSQLLATGENYKTVSDIVSALLNAEGERRDEEEDRQTEEPASGDLSLIRKNRMALFQQLTCVLPILDNLLEASVITKQEHDIIRQKTQIPLQARELIDTVLVKGNAAANIFKNCLKEIDSTLYENLFVEKNMKYIPTEDVSGLSLEEQLRRLQEERTCKVCMDREVSIVFIPCGHLVVCQECAPSLRKCPICRGTIKGTVRTFLS
ncbi:baculoviral IAP repeat-containing protein 3 [Cricetulus griseus]|uniref:RING-type E3 ubiquitin transferase n=1 Tax=Cricetulus griseus TaxID=10029 RepID=A0A061I4L9_CRIGR|nr:baculoviral IAP repeat-containing protein 3 [Cricetulus griseus]